MMSKWIEAAENLDAVSQWADLYACCSIRKVEQDSPKAEAMIDQFRELFKPENKHPCVGWWKEGERQPRVIALMLMHEITKTNTGGKNG